MPIITLLTDFGLKDYYVSSMKAVILSICPSATVVDISHEVSSFDVLEAAFVLCASYRYFPHSTIHVVVVDPGVGSERKALVFKTKNYYFIGPDNGVLTLAADLDGIVEVREIANREFMLHEISRTFHGRDIFAPTAAYLACGVPMEEFGPIVSKYEKLSFQIPQKVSGEYQGFILHIDKFGNIITNIPSSLIPDAVKEVKLLLSNGKVYNIPLVNFYVEVPKGSILAIRGSSGFLEISINQGNAASTLKVNRGEKIILKLH